MPKIETEWPAYKIAQLRMKLGLTQQQLADRVGVHRITVIRWERGVVPPSTLAKLALRRLNAGQ